ncbi:hypothetical protein cypCar_00039997, partial [Cyprinus carpio]
MFWNPAPPKFICAPFVMKDTLFPKYQIKLAHLCKENLLDELHNVVDYHGSPKQFSLLCHSLPMIPDFETFATDPGGIPDIWDAWFDEVFLPLENIQSAGSLPDGLEENQVPQDEIQDLNRVVLDEGLNTTDLDHKVAKPTQTLTECRNHRAFKWCRRGALHIKLGCLNQALEDLNATFTIISTRTDAMMISRIQHFNSSKWMQALEDFSLLLKQEPGNARARHSRFAAVAHVSLGLICMLNMDRHYEAIKKFRNALKEDPIYLKAYVCRARAYYNALRDYSITLLLGCKTELELKVLINSGLLYVELNDYDSALQ